MTDAITARLADHVKEYARLKDLKKRLEDKLKETNKELKKFQEQILPKAMEDEELHSIPVIGVGTVYLRHKVYVSLTGADLENGATEPPFYDWARENAPDLISPYIHPKRLESWAKDRLEGNLPLPDNMIKASIVPTATLRGANGQRS